MTERASMSDSKILIRCSCGKIFDTPEAKQMHKIDKHQSHRRFNSTERPRERGQIECGYPNCASTFKNEWNASQHRRDVHGEVVLTATECEPHA